VAWELLVTILSAFIGGILAIIVVVVLDLLSAILFGRSVSNLIFGNSGVQCLVVPMVGAVLGFIFGNKLTERREQARINREIEQDRLRYASDKKSPV
jgi:hypothetical protein